MMSLAVLYALSALAKKEEISCPHGYELLGEMCKRWKEIPLVPYCKVGVITGDHCIQYAKPSPICLSGEYTGKSCVQMDMTSPEMICPSDYVMATGKKSAHCEKSYTYTVEAPCPKGTTSSGKDCISYKMEPATYWCPEGTEMQGEWCKSWSTYDCTPSKKGMVPVAKKSKKKGHGGHHHRRLGAKPHIVTQSKGKVSTAVVSKMCEKEIKTPIVKKCPPGTMQSGKTCKSTISHERGVMEKIAMESAPIDAICPHPYDWCSVGKKHGGHGGHHHRRLGHKSQEMCCKSITEEPVWKCPSGYFESKEGCMIKTAPIYICQNDHKKKHMNYSGGKDSCSEWEYTQPIRKVTLVVEQKHKKKHYHL